MTEESMSLVVFDPAKAMVADLVKKDASQVLDHTTEAGEKALRSWVYRVKCGKGDIEKTRKATKADALAFNKKVDALAKELTEPLQGIIDARMKPLNELEAKKRIEAEAIVEAERVAAEEAEAERIADLARREAKVKEAEDKIIAAAAEKERIAREKRIAEEAAEQAQIDAAEAIKKTNQDAIDAAEKAKQDAKQAKWEADERQKAAIETEKKRVADLYAAEQAEKDRLDKIEADRVANVEHRESIHASIEDCLVGFTGDSVITNQIIEALIAGEIPNVKIEY